MPGASGSNGSATCSDSSWCRGGRRPRSPRSWISSVRSEEHKSELQSLMSNSYSGFCFKKTNRDTQNLMGVKKTDKNLKEFLLYIKSAYLYYVYIYAFIRQSSAREQLLNK